jgi:hypothetical protein
VVDSGIYFVKAGQPIEEPAQMRLIRNDPRYNEQWPRALVPYARIYGLDEPKRLTALPNDGRQSPHLPEGTPFGLVGTSSLYKRESFPNGVVPPGSVTATWAGSSQRGLLYQGWDPFNGDNVTRSWTHQGAEAGRYDNSDIHAIRILAMEATTDHGGGPNRRFFNHANERLRILGEIPVRKFSAAGQPTDPDGNPDTSFLARIPADVAFTFQTLDVNGMVLNMAQTWHQVRPGEIRHNCGGCHSHSQQPTRFEQTAASRSDYQLFDLTKHTPLLTTKDNDQSGRQWDEHDRTGLRYAKGVLNVEYHRDIVPILNRSCAACHTEKDGREPSGKLVLDDASPRNVPSGPSVPGTYYRLAMDERAEFGHAPLVGRWTATNASRYVRKFQSRRSLLVWKVFGRRLDGWTNEDFPTETTAGDKDTLQFKGEAMSPTLANVRLADLDYIGSAMPPSDAQVAPLSDEDRFTIARWIDLGCPIDLDGDYGWHCDDHRPTLTVASPQAGVNESITRLLIGMYDHYAGLDLQSLQVVADFPIDDVAAGENLARRFQSSSAGVWELKLSRPITSISSGWLRVSVQDRQGNVSRIVRRFSVTPQE